MSEARHIIKSAQQKIVSRIKSTVRFFKNHHDLSRAVVALVLVLAIFVSLLVATPVRAVELSLPNLPSTMYANSLYAFYGQVDIQSYEALPISSLRLDFTGPSSAWVIFDPDGTIGSQS